MKAKFNLNKNKYHILFIVLFSINYFFPLAVFNEITLFYHDVLDAGVVYYHILGKFLNGSINNTEIFLNGNIKVEYLRHWLRPYTLIYSVLNTQVAYWLTEILIKITSYVAFFLLAKKICKNFFFCTLSGALYSCLNIGYIEGFGTAIFPYLLYLALFKKKINLKHFFIIIFFGLNSDLVRDIYVFPIIITIVWIINGKLDIAKFLNILKITIAFYIPIFVTSLNLVYSQFFEGPFHREEFFSESINYTDSFINFLKSLIKLNLTKTWTFFFDLPYTIIFFPLIIISIYQKNITIKKILFFYFIVNFFIIFLSTPFINDLRNQSSGIFRSYNFHWVRVYVPFIIALLFIFNLKENKFNNTLVSISFIAILIFQINSSIIPILKKFNNSEFRNFYTFNGYYLYDDYNNVKKIINEKRVMSIGLDPMVAVMNNIKTIDGYHTLYPLKYKYQFRKIIELELNKNKKLKNYYDNWGSRVYAFIENSNNIQINFSEAKKIGADFVISKFKLSNDKLSQVCQNCSDHFYVYYIN